VVTWPAVISISGDAELIYVADQHDWEDAAELHLPAYDEADYLLDARGSAYRLTTKADNRVMPEPTGERRTLPEVLGLVKAHAAQSGSCCVSKLYAPTIQAAIEMVRSLDTH
jgi:hypothetical protein